MKCVSAATSRQCRISLIPVLLNKVDGGLRRFAAVDWLTLYGTFRSIRKKTVTARLGEYIRNLGGGCTPGALYISHSIVDDQRH